jgi:hypothetical protein
MKRQVWRRGNHLPRRHALGGYRRPTYTSILSACKAGIRTVNPLRR